MYALCHHKIRATWAEICPEKWWFVSLSYHQAAQYAISLTEHVSEHCLSFQSFISHQFSSVPFSQPRESRVCSQITPVSQTEQRRFQSALELSECRGCIME